MAAGIEWDDDGVNGGDGGQNAFPAHSIVVLRNWLLAGCEVPICPRCGWGLYLVVQIYCPLDHDKCHSWMVYRSQSKKNETASVNLEKSLQVDDWGVDADNWDAEESHAATVMGAAYGHNGISPIRNNNKNYTTESIAAVRTDGTCKTWLQNMSEPGRTGDHDSRLLQTDQDNSALTRNSLSETQVGFEQLNVDEVNDDENIPNEQLSQVCSEKPRLRKDQLTCMLELVAQCQPKTALQSAALELRPWYLAVVEEPIEMEEELPHVHQLLEDYKSASGVNFRRLFDCSGRETCQPSSTGEEQYEKVSIHHGDVFFHKFMKRLSRFPGQCVRYDFGGCALHMTDTGSRFTPSCCSKCGSKRQFELQLMPALVNILRLPNVSEPAVEFGTVVVFTCAQGCWQGGDVLLEECCFVQCEPEQHVFSG